MRGYRRGEILSHLLLFTRQLKERGLKITPDRVVDAARSLSLIDLALRQDFYLVLKANLVSSLKEAAVFDLIFEEFWSSLPREPNQQPDFSPGETEEGEEPLEGGMLSRQPELELTAGEEGGEEEETRSLYSPEEVFLKKDFSQFSEEEAAILDRELARLLARWAVKVSRRREPAARGREMDFRRSLKKAACHEGEFLDLVRRRRKVKPMEVIVLCDVSGSMDASTSFILQFLLGLGRAFPRSEFFVFSTSLTRITDILRHRPWPQALAALSRRVRDWSGGTRIGHCLKVFNEQHAKRLTAGSAVIILISDGWDRGEPEQLAAEMKRIKRKARKLIWLNPLLGAPDYRPLCLGMRTALPYVDHFLPANTLQGLMAMGEVLMANLG